MPQTDSSPRAGQSAGAETNLRGSSSIQQTTVNPRPLPHDLDAERAVLACVLYGTVLPSTLDLTGDDFYQPDHEALWNVLETMEQAGENIDPVVAAQRLNAAVERLADPALVPSLAGGPEIPDNAGTYADMVHEASRRRHALAFVQQAEQRLAQGDDPADVLDPTQLETLAADHHSSGGGAVKVWKATDLEPSKPLEWLAIGRIPFAVVTAIAGEEGIGKSLFDAWLAAIVTTGRAVPEFGIPARDPMEVCLVLTEDDWTTIARPRFEAAGVDLSHVSVICSDADGSGSPVFPRDIGKVYSAHPDLVLVDAFADTVEARLTLKDGQQARQALHPWKEVATRTGAAVVLLTHTNRTDTRSTRNAWGYSAEIRKKVRVGLLALPDADGRLAIGPDKANVVGSSTATLFSISEQQYWPETPSSPGTVPVLEHAGESDFTVKELFLQAYDRDHPQPERSGRALGADSQDVVDFVAAQAKAGTVVGAQQVADHMGWDAKPAADRLRKLADGGHIRRIMRGTYTVSDSPVSSDSPIRQKQPHSGESHPATGIRPFEGVSGDTAKEAKEAKPDSPEPAGPTASPLALVPHDPCGFCGKSLTGNPGQRICAARHRRAQEAAS